MNLQPTLSVSVKLWLHSDTYVWAPFFFFLDPEDIKGLSLGAIWNSSKGTGLHELVSDFGAHRARVKA